MVRAATPLGLMALALALPVFAATTVHRCGPDGRSFSQTPCRDGAGTSVLLDEAPSPDRLQEARDVATREAAAAARLAGHRQRLERQAQRAPAVIPRSEEEAEPRRSPRAWRSRDFRAIAPAPAASRPAR